jgi:hypothetical protein
MNDGTDRPESTAPARHKQDARAAHEGWLRLHIRIYAVAAVLLIVVDKLTGPALWSFWPLIAWGGVLAVHFFAVKSLFVDEDWVEERARELHDKSYDFGHIDDIRDRIDSADPSVARDADERPLRRRR